VYFADRRCVAASYGPRLVQAFLNLRRPYVNRNSNTWSQMTLSNGRALTGAPPAAQRGYCIVPAGEGPPDATVEAVVGDGSHVSVSVPHPTLGSIHQVVRWAAASGFDGVVAHDLFDLHADIGLRVTATTLVAPTPAQVWVVS
jgi:hypothetical protein